MKNRFGPIYIRHAIKLPNTFSAIALNLFNYLRGCRTRFKVRNGYFTVSDALSVKVLHSARLPLYINGIACRLAGLSEQYMFDEINWEDGDVVIDCGANIGEVGVLVAQRIADMRYIAFEPGTSESEACEENNAGQTVVGKALWNKNGAVPFYIKGETADSSVIEITDPEHIETVEAVTLDSFLEQENIGKIKLLKLEAEGAEPEVLAGAQRSLQNIEFIAADLGPERGEESKNTFCPVVNLLLAKGYRIVGFHHKRCTVLFENTAQMV